MLDVLDGVNHLDFKIKLLQHQVVSEDGVVLEILSPLIIIPDGAQSLRSRVYDVVVSLSDEGCLDQTFCVQWSTLDVQIASVCSSNTRYSEQLHLGRGLTERVLQPVHLEHSEHDHERRVEHLLLLVQTVELLFEVQSVHRWFFPLDVLVDILNHLVLELLQVYLGIGLGEEVFVSSVGRRRLTLIQVVERDVEHELHEVPDVLHRAVEVSLGHCFFVDVVGQQLSVEVGALAQGFERLQRRPIVQQLNRHQEYFTVLVADRVRGDLIGT